MTPRRAILLFTRSIASEIKAKRFSGLSYAQCQQVYRWLIQTAIAVSQQTHAALVIATDKPAPEFIGATHFLIHVAQPSMIDFVQQLKIPSLSAMKKW